MCTDLRLSAVDGVARFEPCERDLPLGVVGENVVLCRRVSLQPTKGKRLQFEVVWVSSHVGDIEIQEAKVVREHSPLRVLLLFLHAHIAIFFSPCTYLGELFCTV